MTDIKDIDDWPARNAYESGTDPVAYAEQRVAMLTQVHVGIAAERENNPAAFPIYSQDLSFEALARRILGGLLAIGWTPPDIRVAGPPLSDFLPVDLDHLDDPESPQ